MNSIKVIFALFILIFYCSCSRIKNSKYNKNLSNLIFSNSDLKNKLLATFELNRKETKVFKVITSRRNEFVRISILQIINKEELNELPSSYFTFKTNTFLCYDGSEVILNNRLDKDFVDKLKSGLESNVLNDTRVFQFDLDSERRVVLHNPAINPYDLNETIHKVFP